MASKLERNSSFETPTSVTEDTRRELSDFGEDSFDEDTIKTLQRMERAWKIVRDPSLNLLTKAKTHSLEEGDGMSIFLFLRPNKDDTQKNHNCEYCYVEKDTHFWLMIINAFPRKEDLFKVYKRADMYIICISMNDHDFGDSTAQQIKLFRCIDDKEVEF